MQNILFSLLKIESEQSDVTQRQWRKCNQTILDKSRSFTPQLCFKIQNYICYLKYTTTLVVLFNTSCKKKRFVKT